MEGQHHPQMTREQTRHGQRICLVSGLYNGMSTGRRQKRSRADGHAMDTRDSGPRDDERQQGAHAMYSMTFKIRGLDCAEEVAALQRAVSPVVTNGASLLKTTQ